MRGEVRAGGHTVRGEVRAGGHTWKALIHCMSCIFSAASTEASVQMATATAGPMEMSRESVTRVIAGSRTRRQPSMSAWCPAESTMA